MSLIGQVDIDQYLFEFGIESAVKKFVLDRSLCKKVIAALDKGYRAALLEDHDSDVASEKDRIARFLKSWVHLSLSRLWLVFGAGLDGTITTDVAIQVFLHLLYPFRDATGKHKEFSCIPWEMWESFGQVPIRWCERVVHKEVRAGMATQGAQAAASSSKKRKGTGAVPPWRRSECKLKMAKTYSDVQPQDVVRAGHGHPRCTSAENCIGSSRDILVQHVNRGVFEDIFCASCWRSFLDTYEGADLEGRVVT